MDRVVHYHHPEAENFSLKYSSASPAEVYSRQAEQDGATKLLGYPFDVPVYVLYVGDPNIEDASDIDFAREWLNKQIKDLPRSGQVLAFRLMELLEAAVEVRDEGEFRLYKAFEPQKIQEALNHVSWGEALPRVAGEVMSNLILRHSLPNANHRTSIGMLQFCIESIEPDFEMPRTHVDDYRWQEWVDPYIVDSKRLITVRRNNIRFNRLGELGVDFVERKDGIQIRLEDFDLDMPWWEAHSSYATVHEDLCTDFARDVLQHVDREDLLDKAGPTRAAFIDYLESGLDERNLSKLF